MKKQKPACIEPHDNVILDGKPGIVLEVNGERAMIYSPALMPTEPYIVCYVKDLIKDPKPSWVA